MKEERVLCRLQLLPQRHLQNERSPPATAFLGPFPTFCKTTVAPSAERLPPPEPLPPPSPSSSLHPAGSSGAGASFLRRSSLLGLPLPAGGAREDVLAGRAEYRGTSRPPPIRRNQPARPSISAARHRYELGAWSSGSSGLGAVTAEQGRRRRSHSCVAKCRIRLVDDRDRALAELEPKPAARSSTRLRSAVLPSTVPLTCRPDPRNPPVRPSIGTAGHQHGLGTWIPGSGGLGAATKEPQQSQRPREPQPPRRCATATGKLLETLRFCSTRVCSLLLHIADARR
jgi:hypothetical protein